MNAQTDRNRESSLLSYLAGRIDSLPVGLSLTSFDLLVPDNSPSFIILHDSDPLTRVAEASFVTDSGSALKKVFLLLQKDRYDIARDDLWPLTNRDIDDAWQRAFALHADRDSDGSRILFAGQIGDDGFPNLFASLFFCRTRKLFFHPPCPLCGRSLSLCMDDALLLSSGLHPYSRSTKRYLHCASCSTHGSSVFYVHVRGHDDQETLQDLRALIDSFGNVLKDPDPACGFPCTRCPDHDACYGENRASQTRIVPFSFYPFYLLIFDSLSLPALDFLRLVSGASLDELISTLSAKSELGRVSCLEEVRRNGLVGSPLFSIHDERYFLEVLYLKLSFLGDVFRQIFPPQGITGQPEMKLTIDRIWVGLAGQSGFLPPFWNFRTKILDIVRPSGVSQLFTSPVSSNLLQAALLWFYALLVNNRQSSRDLMISLKEAISGNISLTGIPSSIHSTNPVFSPEQIFWEPDGKAVHRNRVPLWEKSIDMGFELLHAATHPDQQWSCESFFVNFEKYRAEVREAMFGNASLTIERPSQDYQLAEDENIHKILTGIIGKWRVSGKVETLPKRSEEAAEMTDTIILSSARIDTPASSIRDEEEWTETVILSARNEIVTPSPHSQFRDGAVLETVVLSPVRATSEPITPTLLEEVEDDVPQTIILSPGLRPEETIVVKKVPEGSPIGAVKEDIAHGDDLPETVMLNPQKARFKSKGWKD